jgi:biopolymer transport protein ExbB/TolQ
MVWEAITAISLAIMAIIWVFLGLGLLSWMRARRRTWEVLDRFAELLEREGIPVLLAARGAVEDIGKAVRSVRSEVDEVVGTSRVLRGRVEDVAASLEERVRDIEAVLDVLQEELEETVLDFAAVLRTARRGGSVIRALRRAVVGKGR